MFHESQDRLENLTNTKPFGKIEKLAMAVGAVAAGSAALAIDASYLYPLVDTATRARALDSLVHDALLIVGANAILLSPSAIHLAAIKGKEKPIEVWARKQIWSVRQINERYQFNKLDIRPESLRSHRVLLADFQGRIRSVVSGDPIAPQPDSPDLADKAFLSLKGRRTWDSGDNEINPEQAGVLARWVGSTLAIEYMKRARSLCEDSKSLGFGRATKALWLATEASHSNDGKTVQFAWMQEMADQIKSGSLPKNKLRETFEKFVNDPPLAA